MPLDYELHISFSVFLFSSPTPLGGTGWLEGARTGYFLGSDKSPAGYILSPESRPGEKEQNALAYCSSKWLCFFSPSQKSNIHSENLIESFWSKTPNMRRPLCAWVPLEFLYLRHVHIHQVQFGFSCSDTVPWRFRYISLCSIGLWFSAFTCFSNFGGEGTVYSVTSFPYGSMKSYWFFSLFSFLRIARVEWWLLSSSLENTKPGCSSLHTCQVIPWFSVVFRMSVTCQSRTHITASLLVSLYFSSFLFLCYIPTSATAGF